MPKPDLTGDLDEQIAALIERHLELAGGAWEDVATILIGRGVALHIDAVGLASTASLLRALAEAIEERTAGNGFALH